MVLLLKGLTKNLNRHSPGFDLFPMYLYTSASSYQDVYGIKNGLALTSLKTQTSRGTMVFWLLDVF